MTHMRRITIAILGGPRAAAGAARARARDAHRSRRDRRHHARDRPQLPRQPLPCRQPHDRLPGQGWLSSTSCRRRAPARSSLGRSPSASPTPPRSSSSTPTRAARAKPASRSCAPQRQAQPHLQADRPEPARQARTVLRQDRPVPARNHAQGQEGRRHRADRAHLGARAGARLRQHHLLARLPTQGQCSSTSAQTAQTQIGSAVQYYCLYQTARLTYSATLDLHAVERVRGALGAAGGAARRRPRLRCRLWIRFRRLLLRLCRSRPRRCRRRPLRLRLVPPALLPLRRSIRELGSLSALDELDSLSPPVFVVAVVDVAVVCAAAFSALVFVGGVISGVLFGTASETLLDRRMRQVRGRTRVPARSPRPWRLSCATAHGVRAGRAALTRSRPQAGGAPSGPMRRPHVGQSFRSFCASWSHHGQNRRFSTAQGSLELDGASGSSLPTTSSSSPLSRSSVDLARARPRSRPPARWRGCAGGSAVGAHRGGLYRSVASSPGRRVGRH